LLHALTQGGPEHIRARSARNLIDAGSQLGFGELKLVPAPTVVPPHATARVVVAIAVCRIEDHLIEFNFQQACVGCGRAQLRDARFRI
jgi:hypothetical protein